MNPSKIGFLHFYWFQMSTIFFSFCIFSQMLVNSLLTISFLGESLGFMLTHDVFSFVLAFIPTKIFKNPDEPLLPFQEFDTIKLRWNRFLMDSTDFSFYHIELNMIKKLQISFLFIKCNNITEKKRHQSLNSINYKCV